MPQHRRAAEQAEVSPASPGVSQDADFVRRTRQRVDLVSDSPAARIQRLLVLADRFRSLAVLKSDPVRLVDLLRSIISLARETFATDFARDWDARAVIHVASDQVQCVRDLERLLQGLAHGSPEARRSLAHAMDALLIQCMLFDMPASDEAPIADP